MSFLIDWCIINYQCIAFFCCPSIFIQAFNVFISRCTTIPEWAVSHAFLYNFRLRTPNNRTPPPDIFLFKEDRLLLKPANRLQ